MAKKLTDMEVFYIKNNPENLTALQLSQKLGRNETTIRKVLSQAETEAAKENVEVKTEETKETIEVRSEPENPRDNPTAFRVKDLMIKNTSGIGRKGIAIMTPAASELADAHEELRRAQAKPKSRFDGAIFRQPTEGGQT